MSEIKLYWDQHGYPNAGTIKVRTKKNQRVTIVWKAGNDIKSIDAICFQSDPNDSISALRKVNDRTWEAIDTITANEPLKYIVQATNKDGQQAWSPDPVIENEIEPD